MREQIKLTVAAENFLSSRKGYKKSWVRSFLGIVFAAILVGIVMGISYNYGPFSNYVAVTSENSQGSGAWSQLGYKLSHHQDLMRTATYISYAVIACFCTPFVCGLATWLIGINQVTKSKYFHLFMWFMVLLSILLAVVALMLMIRSTVYPIQGIPPAENQDGGGGANSDSSAQTASTVLNLQCALSTLML